MTCHISGVVYVGRTEFAISKDCEFKVPISQGDSLGEKLFHTMEVARVIRESDEVSHVSLCPDSRFLQGRDDMGRMVNVPYEQIRALYESIGFQVSDVKEVG